MDGVAPPRHAYNSVGPSFRRALRARGWHGARSDAIHRASAQNEQEYAETAVALAEKQELTAGEAAEVSQLWRKLVKLFHPDRFAHEPEKQMRVGKIRNPNIEIRNKFQRREGGKRGAGAPTPFFGISISSDLFRISDFDIRIFPGEEREIAQLRRLWTRIELEIIRVLEASNALKESPDYELHRLTTQTPAFFDETVRRHVESLEKAVAALESEAEELAREIKELTGDAAPGIG